MALAVCGPFVAFVAGQLGGHVEFKDKLGLANGPIGFVLYEVDFLKRNRTFNGACLGELKHCYPCL